VTVNREEIVAEFYEAFNQHDIEGIEVHLAPDVQWVTADGGSAHGRAAFKTYWQGTWAKGDVRIEPMQMETLGDKVHVRVQQVATGMGGNVLENKKVEQVFGFTGAFISTIETIDRDPNPDTDEDEEDE
jgi:ketosteroid isomerase-like protein